MNKPSIFLIILFKILVHTLGSISIIIYLLCFISQKHWKVEYCLWWSSSFVDLLLQFLFFLWSNIKDRFEYFKPLLRITFENIFEKLNELLFILFNLLLSEHVRHFYQKQAADSGKILFREVYFNFSWDFLLLFVWFVIEFDLAQTRK